MADVKKQSVQHTCPYCEAEIEAAAFPFCQTCKVTVAYCPSCNKSVPRGKKVCPSCGAEVKGTTRKAK